VAERRLAQLDSLRGLAALAVALQHILSTLPLMNGPRDAHEDGLVTARRPSMRSGGPHGNDA